jgi:hypothetical protein
MPDTDRRMQRCGCALLLAPTIVFLLGGIAAGGAADSNNAASGAAAARASLPRLAQAAQAPPPDVNCPAAEVRRGAATLSVGPTGERTAMTMKYQASFVRLARECAVVDANMVMKIGVEGRVVLGPAGSPGPVSVPLRFAVVQETASGGMRAITTKFITVPVDVGATGNTPFVYVEEALSFPLPTPTTALDDYTVYVGFDPVSAEAQSKPAPKARPKAKPNAKPDAKPNAKPDAKPNANPNARGQTPAAGN